MPPQKYLKVKNLDLQCDFQPQERLDVEDYFILRIPENHAAYVRRLIRSKSKKITRRLMMKLDEQLKTGEILINKTLLPGRMVHLPTITDVCKSTNGITLYKTGTLSQMFVCDGDKTLENVRHDNWPHGISKPLKNVRKQRFRKTMRNDEGVKEANNIQTEVTWLLRTDYEALNSRYEIVYEKVYKHDDEEEEVTEETLFGSMSEETDESDDSSSSLPNFDIMDFN